MQVREPLNSNYTHFLDCAPWGRESRAAGGPHPSVRSYVVLCLEGTLCCRSVWVLNEGERSAVKGLWVCAGLPPPKAVCGMDMLSIRAMMESRGQQKRLTRGRTKGITP